MKQMYEPVLGLKSTNIKISKFGLSGLSDNSAKLITWHK